MSTWVTFQSTTLSPPTYADGSLVVFLAIHV